jgi:TrmH family RNA methyltransferase
MITSLNNPQIKEVKALANAKVRKEKKMFVVEGEHLVKEAKALNLVIKAYTIDESLDGEVVSVDVMKKMSERSTPVRQLAICKYIEKKEISDKILFLDGIQDPGNLGTLLRSACAFNFKTVFLAEGSVDLYNMKVIRSSQGAIFKLNFIYGDSIEFLNKIKKTHKVYSTNVRNGKSVLDIKEKDKFVLILGNEGNGVSDKINNLSFDNLYIPMSNTESLNVGVAGAILMYELNK